jgi:hypothetical protein
MTKEEYEELNIKATKCYWHQLTNQLYY